MSFDGFLVDFDAKTQMRGENLPKNYKNGLVDWFGRKNVTITISIHCQKYNGYTVQSWTGWTDWTDQSKLGLVTHTLWLIYHSLKHSFRKQYEQASTIVSVIQYHFSPQSVLRGASK